MKEGLEGKGRKIGLRPGGEGRDPEQRRVLRQRISETDGDISSHPPQPSTGSPAAQQLQVEHNEISYQLELLLTSLFSPKSEK